MSEKSEHTQPIRNRCDHIDREHATMADRIDTLEEVNQGLEGTVRRQQSVIDELTDEAAYWKKRAEDCEGGNPGPGPGPEPPERETKHAHRNMTADENKDAYLPEIRAKRAPTTDEQHGVIRYGQHADVPGNFDEVLPELVEGVAHTTHDSQNVSLTNRSLGEWIDKKYHPKPNPEDEYQPEGRTTFRNCTFTEGPGGEGRQKWGMRFWNSPEKHTVDCDFTEIPIEHGDYTNTNRGFSMYGCTALRLGGALYYFASRPNPDMSSSRPGEYKHPPGNLPFDQPTRYEIKGCHAIDTERHPSRGDSAFKFFNAGSYDYPGEILIEDSTAVQCWEQERHEGTNDWREPGTGGPKYVRAMAALVVTSYPKDMPVDDQARLGDAWSVGLLTIKNSLFDMTQANKNLASLNDVREVRLIDSCFIARDHRNPFLQIDSSAISRGLRPVERVVIENCVAKNVRLKIHHNGAARLFEVNTPGRRVVIENGQVVSDEPIEA